jgi:steroid delta-isomerase-like uncharacterized protein
VDPKEVVQRHVDAWNARDFESFVEGYTDDCEVTGPGFTFKGQQGIRDFWAAFNGPYPDNRVLVHRLVAEGSTVIEEATFQGTHTGSMTAPDGREIPPTNRPVALGFADVHTLRGELIASSRIYLDQLDLLAQLGLAPG